MMEGWIQVIFKIGKALVLVCLTLAAAFITAPYISNCLSLSSEEIKIFRLGALGMVAWGVLGKSTWEIQTWKGSTSHERFNSWWFTALYVLGLFVGGLGLLVEPM